MTVASSSSGDAAGVGATARPGPEGPGEAGLGAAVPSSARPRERSPSIASALGNPQTEHRGAVVASGCSQMGQDEATVRTCGTKETVEGALRAFVRTPHGVRVPRTIRPRT